MSKQLPQNIKIYWESYMATEVNKEISDMFDFDLEQSIKMTDLINDIYFKKKAVDQLDKALLELELADDNNVKKMALEILGKKFLVVDDEWFDGKVVKKMKDLGGEPSTYNNFLLKYKEEVKYEVEARKKEEQAEIEKQKREEDRQLVQHPVMATPEEEKKSAITVFESNLLEIIKVNDYESKHELNNRLIYLLYNDNEKKFQNALLKALYNNKEKVTAKEIITKGENKEPTVENWIKDYIHYVGLEDSVSSLQKAQYFIHSINIKKLDESEKSLVDSLLDVFIAIRNYYNNIEKYDLEDLFIFPFSEVEIKEHNKELSEKKHNQKQNSNSDKSINVEDLIAQDPEERIEIQKIKQEIIKKTRKEYPKIAQDLQDSLMDRHKLQVVAALEILVETGALDNVLAQNKDYQILMEKYFKRNNLESEAEEFKKNPYQVKFMEHFLKFVFLERLGMTEAKGAKYASNIAEMFIANDKPEYAQIAYFDMEDKKFKWI